MSHSSEAFSADNRTTSTATEISDGIFAYVQADGTWWINNTGFLVGRRGVVSIDACATARRTTAYLEAITAVTQTPVRTLINTHHHGDHTFGNYLFTEATIVAHDGVRQGMAAWGVPKSAPFWTEVEWGPVELVPPFLTFEDRVRVYVDELVCEVAHVGTPAHTVSDSVVWIPERGVLFSGDLIFNGGMPFLLQGSISGARVALDSIRALGAQIIVPGHGLVCGPEAIEEVDLYLAFVQMAALDGHAAGLTPLEIARDLDLGEFAALSDPERIVGNLHRALAEIDGLPPGAPIDAHAALADMVEFNGGRPLTCLA